MKIVDRLVIQSFLGPYVLSFFIAEFVLIMQFLWKYIDDILGKGFSILDVLELIFVHGTDRLSDQLLQLLFGVDPAIFGKDYALGIHAANATNHRPAEWRV